MTQTFPIIPASGNVFFVLAPLAVLMFGLLVLFGYLGYSSRHVSFEVSPEGLRINGDIYGRMVPAASLVASGARELNLNYDTEHRPVARTNGTGLPGYLAGWFRLGNREKALVFVTDKSHAVYIPTRDGYSLLVSPAEPQAFIAALQQTASSR